MSEIDADWLQRELLRVAKKLTEQFPDVASATIEEVVREAAGELVSGARIFTSLPVLIQRRAQARLQAIHVGQWTPVRTSN